MVTSSIVFAGIAPHPPIMVPEVGGSATSEVRASIDSMKELTERLISSGAETVVLISPHAPLEARAFVSYRGDVLYGSFARFSAAGSGVEAALDVELLLAITHSSMDAGYRVVGIDDVELDHGTSVPLYFLRRYGWQGKVVCFGYSSLSNDDHLTFGRCIRTAVDARCKPAAIIASGDLSHRLKPGAPAGFDKDAHLFDREIVGAIRDGDPERIVRVDPVLRARAGECGYRSMLVTIGATEHLTRNYELLSYEAPFGVGYMVAQLTRHMRTLTGITTKSKADPAISPSQDLPALARKTVETYIREKQRIKPTSADLNFQAACFVSIKTLSGELRGCVGTIEPTLDSLEEELITNAINAATRDLRFPVITTEELPQLRYSVDILSEIELVSMEQLDPKRFGVVVEEPGTHRRGVLLPELSGIDNAEQQVAIAMRKAGIKPGKAVRLFRFRVSRFRESDALMDYK